MLKRIIVAVAFVTGVSIATIGSVAAKTDKGAAAKIQGGTKAPQGFGCGWVASYC